MMINNARSLCVTHTHTHIYRIRVYYILYRVYRLWRKRAADTVKRPGGSGRKKLNFFPSLKTLVLLLA